MTLISTLFFAFGLVQEIPPLIRTIVTLAPSIARIPILGRVIISLGAVQPLDGTKALEELQNAKDKRKKDREKRQQANSRYVIKVSEAMKCVEKNVDGGLLLKIGKGVVDVLSGSGGDLGTEIMDPIYQCLEENRLRQDTPRSPGSKTIHHPRPAKGHGTGRGSF